MTGDRSRRTLAAPPRDWWIERGLVRPGEHGPWFWLLSILFHVPLYLFLLFRSVDWFRRRLAPAPGFLLIFYWVYWGEHAILWGDPRYGLAVYPVLLAIALTGGGLTFLAPMNRPDVAALRRSARQNPRLDAAFRAAIALAPVTRSADMEAVSAQTALTQDQQDGDSKTLPDGEHPGSRDNREV